jgi:lactoylglutathione lyase
MRINHIAIFTSDLELMKTFYIEYFNAKVISEYRNPMSDLKTIFLGFENGSKLEIMTKPGLLGLNVNFGETYCGYAHIAFSVGSKGMVDALTETLENDGFEVISFPRVTGDGFYESVVADPEGNKIEITV